MTKITKAQASGTSPAIDGASVLIVDDEKHIRLMLRTILEAEGCKVGEAADGREALNLLKSVKFDVMVLDLNMKVLDGMGVLKELKENPPRTLPRVIVLTAYGSTSAAVRATRLGALDFLEKPASPKEVREAVAAVLSEPQPASQHPVEGDTEGGYEGVMKRVRRSLRESDIAGAESLLMKAADLAQHDAGYFNLLGVIYETRRQWRLAKKFYSKAMRADGKYKPAEQNMRRIYELETFGRSRESVALGDEATGKFTALEELQRELKTAAKVILNDQVVPMDVTQSHRILIVDDEHNIRVVLRAALESAGYLVEQAPDGAAALKRIATGGIDLMVLDLNMPVLDGMTVLQQLHDREPPKPRVIVFTAHGSIPFAVKAVRLGASDFLEKPISPADFLLSVASVLKETVPAAARPDAQIAATSDVLRVVRREIAHKDLKRAERLLNDIAEKAATDPAYFNLPGVIHEAEGNRRAARTFYQKAATLAGGYEPAKENLRRLQDLETYGRTHIDVKLGNEDELIGGLGGAAAGQGKFDPLRRITET